MAGNKMVSACCLGYMHAPYIRECVASIWADPWPEKEIIALDDGSQDGSLDILRQLAAESPCPFTILEQENSGNVPRNFNRLWKSARGGFLLFTSLDDMQTPGAISRRMEKLLENDNSIFAAHTKCFATRGESLIAQTTPLGLMGGIVDAARGLELERTQLHSFYIQGALFRKSAVQAVQGFSENMIGDDIVLRTKLYFHLLAHPQLTFALIDDPGFVYRRHEGNISRNVARQLKLAIQYYDRFWQDRPYPEMIRRWLLTGIESEPWETILDIFTLGNRAAQYLRDEEVRTALRLNAVRSCAKEMEPGQS